MLCPKCGYISFDHLTSCQKCDNDLTVISAELRGTSAKVEQYSFLNAVLREPISAEEPPVVDEEDSDLDSRVVDDEVMELGEVEGDSDLAVEGDLVADAIDTVEDAGEPELAVDLDEMAPLDLDSIESVEAGGLSGESDSAGLELEIDGENSDEPGADLEVGGEVDSLTFDGDLELSEDLGDTIELEIIDDAPDEAIDEDVSEIELLELQDDTYTGGENDAVVADGDLEIDTSSLSLELDDIAVGDSQESEAEIVEDGADARAEDELTIDLDQIDLSDLVDDSEGDGSSGTTELPEADSLEAVSELPKDEIVLTLEDDDVGGGGDVGASDLPALDDGSNDEIMLELDGLGDSVEDAGGADTILDLSLETDNDDAVIDSLTDIIDLSLEDDTK